VAAISVVHQRTHPDRQAGDQSVVGVVPGARVQGAPAAGAVAQRWAWLQASFESVTPMKALFSWALAIGCISQLVASSVDAQILRVEGLKTEYQQNPIGIDVRAPRLSWRIQADRRGTMQSAYEIRVATDSGSLARAPLWDSGKLPSTSSIFRPYSGPATRSGARYYWQVRAWDNEGRISPWSTAEFWEMGLLDHGDWSAQWITPDLSEDTSRANPSPMLRREVTLTPRVASARLSRT